MIDETTVVISTGRNRTLSNLQGNPYAVFLIMEPGRSIMDWEGIRVYTKAKQVATSCEILDASRRGAAKFIGKEASKMMQASVASEATEVRPLIDFGQG